MIDGLVNSNVSTSTVRSSSSSRLCVGQHSFFVCLHYKDASKYRQPYMYEYFLQSHVYVCALYCTLQFACFWSVALPPSLERGRSGEICRLDTSDLLVHVHYDACTLHIYMCVLHVHANTCTCRFTRWNVHYTHNVCGRTHMNTCTGQKCLPIDLTCIKCI